MSTCTYHGQYSYAQIWYSVPTTAEQLSLITEYEGFFRSNIASTRHERGGVGELVEFEKILQALSCFSRWHNFLKLSLPPSTSLVKAT